MYPNLLTLGTFTVHTYGVCIALGALLGILLISREATKQGYNQQQILDLAFYGLISAIIGSRVFYIVLNVDYYLKNPLEMVMIWRGGLVFYGGFIFAFVTCFFYLKKQHLPFLRTCDILAPGLALGEAFGRIGCFFAGCCYGTATNLPWAVIFNHPQSLAKTGIPLHPTQLYASSKALAVFAILMIFRRFKKSDGQVIWLYSLLYALGRLFIEPFRGDERGLMIFGTLTLTQTIALIFVPLALFMVVYLGRRKPSSSNSRP
jgi:phosphatidylglycerol:prolipoprotein diacylglycerol transferase